jgi:hypothetical protein
MKARLAELIKAAEHMDWMQIVLNHQYGPPCFYLGDDGGRFCGRAKTWFGHDGDPHDFVSFEDLLREISGERKEQRV